MSRWTVTPGAYGTAGKLARDMTEAEADFVAGEERANAGGLPLLGAYGSHGPAPTFCRHCGAEWFLDFDAQTRFFEVSQADRKCCQDRAAGNPPRRKVTRWVPVDG